ncbi:hypothetical protein SaSA73_0026 [Streptococcus agalactiae]|nr:hypothetical protein SaSA53_0025 [Streptococcus agalactiae]EJZ02546.1 hypothetical protein M3M_09193 [Streptococcus agalactiae STIR-CD-17]AUO84562.1 hypothetical protein SaSA73_0026 [Streptococcus agalactiae]AUO92785.1 hypothetical protein SaSA75_0026 [Streptococcus agalactiae]AUO97785.1 hypothetical protein SaSA85_0026 [Streptococcus agalactiae]
MDKLKKLQKENTLLEGRIDNSNNQTYTDMIVYLRGASISPYHQELIRNDIVNMLLEAQERQASLVSVFGEDRHDFINQVIKSTPKISKKEETLQRWDLAILLLTIQMIIFLGGYLITEALQQSVPDLIPITLLDVLFAIFISIIAVKIADTIIYATYNFDKSKEIFLSIYVSNSSLIIAYILIGKYCHLSFINIPLWIYLIILGLSFSLHIIVKKYLNKHYYIEF